MALLNQIVRDVLAAMLLLATGIASGSDLGHGSISGMVLSEDGTAISGALIAVTAEGYYGRHPTRTNGSFSLRDIPEGSWFIEVHCPSVAGVGREITVEPVVITADETLRLEITAPASHCDEPPYEETTGYFSGYFSHGFESSSFSFCNKDDLGLSQNSFFEHVSVWVNLPSGAYSRFEAGQTYYLKVLGTLKGPGNFGHLGVSLYGLDISTVTYSKNVEEKDCVGHDQEAT